MPPIARTLDANANRAREAMRVMEDAARFCLDDSKLARDLKNLRHDFAAAVRSLPDLPAHRDTPNDVGTSITTAAERTRATVADVAIAAVVDAAVCSGAMPCGGSCLFAQWAP